MKRSTIGVSIIWLIIWQVTYLLIGNDLLFPSPLSTMTALGQLIVTPRFYGNIGFTFYRVLGGVVISIGLGIVTALLAYYYKWIEAFVGPMMIALKVTPVMAIIILALLWFSSGSIPVFTCFLMCYPVTYTNILTGLKTVDKELLEMAKIFKVSKAHMLKNIYLPHLKPYLESALKLVVGLSWKVVIAAEVLSVPAYSMGYNLLNAKVYLEADQLFAWVIVIIILSSICEKSVEYLIAKGKGLEYDTN